ncbi:Asparagine-rich protein, partial [Reticulomyxa filosa]
DMSYVIITHAYDVTLNVDIMKFCPKCGKELKQVKSASKLMLQSSKDPSKSPLDVHFEGAVHMPSGAFARIKEKYLVLHGKFLYQYKRQKKTLPECTLFIQGYFVESEHWCDALERATHTVDIRKYYDIKDQLGKGSFAQVFRAEEKQTNRIVAVKVIEKKAIDGKQKEYIRVELSVMKLVRHPNVVKLENVF